MTVGNQKCKGFIAS